MRAEIARATRRGDRLTRAPLHAAHARAWLLSLPDHNPAFEPGIVGMEMIVEAARARDDEVAGFAALPWVEQAHRIDRRALEMIGVIVRRHVVRAAVVVDEQRARAGRHHELGGGHAARRW